MYQDAFELLEQGQRMQPVQFLGNPQPASSACRTGALTAAWQMAFTVGCKIAALATAALMAVA